MALQLIDRMEGKLQSKEADIRRRLDNSGITKPAEFEEIIEKLIAQKDRLEQDLRMLREKVVALHQKQAMKMQKERLASKGSRPKLRAKPAIDYRQQLNRKHEELKLWQKRVLRATKNQKSQVEHREIMNRLASIEHEIGLQLQRYSDQKMTYKRLRKALKLFDKQDQKKSYLQEGMQRENKLLKRRVFSLKKIVDNQISKEIDLQTHLIDIRDKERYIEQLARNANKQQSQLKSSRHSKTIQRHRTEVEPSSVGSLSDQSQKEDTVSLDVAYIGQNFSKDEIYQLEGHLNRKETRFREDLSKIQKRIKKNYPNQALNVLREGSKLTFGKELDLILDHCRKGIHKYADLNRQKIKLLLEKQSTDDFMPQNQRGNLRYTSTSVAQGLHRSELSYHSSNKSVKRLAATISPLFQHQSTGRAKLKQKSRTSQKQVQTETQTLSSRRQFIGQIKDDRTDDRQILRQYQNSTIKTLKVYYTDRGIASIQAIYNLNNNGGKTLDGRLILPQHFIENYCKVHTIQTSNDDFIRYFKLRYHSEQNRITSMRIVTNRNIKNGFGQPKSLKGQDFDDGSRIEKEYVFDIGRDEFPSSIFCSHVQKGPYWYLCGFGATIDDL